MKANLKVSTDVLIAFTRFFCVSGSAVIHPSTTKELRNKCLREPAANALSWACFIFGDTAAGNMPEAVFS